MKSLLLAIVCITGFQIITPGQKTKTIKKVIELEMPKGTGTNGASVAYHPVQKKYYASFAGNASYPMSVFDAKGNRLSKDDLQAGFDVRGLWYNNISKTLQGNGYDDFGWTNFILDKSGIPSGNTVFVKEKSQPNEQSVGAFDEKKKMVYFLSEKMIVAYDVNGTQKKETKLLIREDETEEEEDEEDFLPEKFNNTSVISTGIAKAEWGLLDLDNNEVILFDGATGKATQKWTIDSNAGLPASFGFSYTNGIVFIFDKENRKWIGYK